MLVSSVQTENHQIQAPQNNHTPELQMIYDPEGATEATLQPGDTERLFGWLHLINNTGYPMKVKMSFDLKNGLQISMEIHTPDGIIHQEQNIFLNETMSARLEPVFDETTGEEVSTIILYPANTNDRSAKLGSLSRLSKISNRV